VSQDGLEDHVGCIAQHVTNDLSEEAIAHLSPGQFETINPYGTLTFDIPGVLQRPRRPPAAPNPR